ncbi:MAG: YebC/PmpR family DNA-binding transcriptional regulator [Candidatus Paceibacterota bacterium]|jgi:YebC/PmpR family DNA-binding regulatory protein
MSGHSHFATIKHKKEATDAKKSKVFSKISRLITIAVKEKGPSVETNSQLKLAIDLAKKANMPSDNIERAIKKGSGDLEGEKLEEFAIEAYGPGGTAIIIEGITDNKNRTLGDIKQALSQYGGKMVAEGAVKWMFERKGMIILDASSASKSKEEIEMDIIDAGADDIRWKDEAIEVNTKIQDLESVKSNLEAKGFAIDSAALGWVAKEEISLEGKDEESNQKLFEALDEDDSVQSIYSNLK